MQSSAPAYRVCRQIAASHYENFPVASWLLPRALRDPIAAIYAFARRADDFADEGQVSAQQRLGAIDALQGDLLAALNSEAHPDPVCHALADACRRFDLPVALLLDLLSAFRQDVTKQRYDDDAELDDYCRRSANPVGRLLLILSGDATPTACAESDQLCTALQLLNFLQDLHADYWQRGRLYLPRSSLQRFGVTESDLFESGSAEPVAALMSDRIERIEDRLAAGAALPERLSGRLRWEIRATWQAAREVAQNLRHRGARLDRPARLARAQKLKVLLRALRP